MWAKEGRPLFLLSFLVVVLGGPHFACLRLRSGRCGRKSLGGSLQLRGGLEAEKCEELVSTHFTFDGENTVDKVEVVGEWSSWQTRHPLTQDSEGKWTGNVSLPVGRFSLKFVVSPGDLWLSSKSMDMEADSSGILNNIVEVNPPTASPEVLSTDCSTPTPEPEATSAPAEGELMKEAASHVDQKEDEKEDATPRGDDAPAPAPTPAPAPEAAEQKASDQSAVEKAGDECAVEKAIDECAVEKADCESAVDVCKEQSTAETSVGGGVQQGTLADGNTFARLRAKVLALMQMGSVADAKSSLFASVKSVNEKCVKKWKEVEGMGMRLWGDVLIRIRGRTTQKPHSAGPASAEARSTASKQGGDEDVIPTGKEDRRALTASCLFSFAIACFR